MRKQLRIVLAMVAASVTCPLGALADNEPIATAEVFTYAADTTESPRAVTDAATLAEFAAGTWRIAWRAGEKVTVTAPDGTVTTLADGSSAGTAVATLSAGGCWTFANSRRGESKITVRYSLYGSAGIGTESDPLKVVDDGEIADIDGGTLTPGLHIALRGAPGLDLSSLALGSGLSLTGLGGGVWRIDSATGGIVATSVATGYCADSMPSPRAVRTAEDASTLWQATRRAGETVTLKSPMGTTSTLIAANSAATSAALPLNEGGLWTVENSKQGMATFTVRHSLYGTLGDGTVASPARLVDGGELVDYSAGDGYTFTLNGGDSLFAALVIPAGYRLEEVGDDKWKIVSTSDGSQYVWAEIAYAADSEQEGPRRKTQLKLMLPVSYSGDNWVGDDTAAATVTFVSPKGIETVYNLIGTGAQSFDAWESGVWTVTLVTAAGTQTATVTVTEPGSILIFR